MENMEVIEEALEEFPCALESEVASALLLLSCTSTVTPPSLTISSPPPLKRNEMKKRQKRIVKSSSMWMSLSGSSSSTVSSDNRKQLKVTMTHAVAKFQPTIALKVVRKQRSKVFCVSDSMKSNSGVTQIRSEDSSSSITVTSSCVSNASSSAISTARSYSSSGEVIKRRDSSDPENGTKDPNRKPDSSSGHMGRRAEAILKFLSYHGCASEVKIREWLGDSPSTSKALRILLKMEKVKRSGGGGRRDPYVYKII